jgi:hypothetical protein
LLFLPVMRRIEGPVEFGWFMENANRPIETVGWTTQRKSFASESGSHR